MPEAKVLSFPTRRVSGGRPSCDRDATVQGYLSTAADGRDPGLVRTLFADPDALIVLGTHLRARSNSSPEEVASEAAYAYTQIARSTERVGFLDEREFFMGEMALLAATTSRALGRRQDTELWLDRAEANYRHVVNSEPQLGRSAYVRLALRYDMRRYDDVLELLPSIALTFRKLGMAADLAKCHFLEAMALKDLGRVGEAEACFVRLTSDQDFQAEPAWVGAALVHLGSLQSDGGRFPEALSCYARARPLLEATKQATTLADLKMMVGDTLRRTGHPIAAIEAYRESVEDHARLGLATRTAYLRVVLAEGLLEAGRPREAEWELLAALPTIEEQKMLPEALLAVGLLRESVQQRKTDPKALSAVRSCLQAQG